jgi:RNA polymerase sigma-70 factor, ECF subfamily
MDFYDCIARFNQMENRVYQYIQNMVNNTSSTQEIIQDIQVRIYKNYLTLRENTFEHWVFRVARNISINYLKRKSLNCISIDELENENMSYCDSFDLELEVERKEYREELRIQVRQLPAIYRIPIEYHYFGQYSYCEIAEMLDRPINTIKSHIRRGVKKLREKIGEGEP